MARARSSAQRAAATIAAVLSLAVCVRCSVGPPAQCGPSSGADSWSPEAWQEAKRLLENDLSVIFVLDPNFGLCWERVEIDAYTNATLLPWIRELKDALTVSKHDVGEDLQFEYADSPWKHLLAEEGLERASFRELIDERWRLGASSVKLPSNLLTMFQLSMVNTSLSSVLPSDVEGWRAPTADTTFTIPLSRIRTTTVQAFWQVVEQTSASGELRVATCRSPDPYKTPDTAALLQPIQGATLVLPRMVPHLHNHVRALQGGQPSRQVLAWGVDYIMDMLQSFVGVAGVSTLPDLREYPILPDKEKLQAMYQAYYDADPATRAPPIPTAFVYSPASKATQQLLCHSDHVPSPQLLDSIMRRLFAAVVELERSMNLRPELKHIDHVIVASTEGPNSSDTMLHYALKRMFSECALNVLFFKLPFDAIRAAGDGSPDNCMFRGEPCYRYRDPVVVGELEFNAFEGTPDWDTSAVQTRPYLLAAAEAIATRSCGEGWMLQPKINNMPRLEYRVYLLNGAKSQPGDEVVVYTPSVLGPNGISLWNLTIPPGFFWSDAIAPPSGPRLVNQGSASGEEAAQLVYNADGNVPPEQRKPFRAPDLYAQVVQAAVDGAKGLAAYENGRLRVIANTFVRVDVVLAAYEKDGQLLTFPLINEMDWFNSAMVVFGAWKDLDHRVAPHDLRGLTGRAWEEASGMAASKGYKMATALLPQIAQSCLDLQRSGAQAGATGAGMCPTADGLGAGLKVADNRTVLLSAEAQPAHLGDVYMGKTV